MDREKQPSLAKRLMVEAGLKKSHAYMIASGDRSPSLQLALKIFERTKMQLGPLAGASVSEIKTLAKLHDRGGIA